MLGLGSVANVERFQPHLKGGTVRRPLRPTKLDKIKNLFDQIHFGGVVGRRSDETRRVKLRSPGHAWPGLFLWESWYWGRPCGRCGDSGRVCIRPAEPHTGVSKRQPSPESGQGCGRVAPGVEPLLVCRPHSPSSPGIRAHHRPRRGGRDRQSSCRVWVNRDGRAGGPGHQQLRLLQNPSLLTLRRTR